MCKQDVRIGRAAINNSGEESGIAGGATATIIPGNGARIAITAALITETADAATIVEVFAGSGDTRVTLGSLNRAQPSFTRKIDEVGIGIAGPIGADAHGTGAAAYTVRVTETYLPQDLESVP